jgi:hypothetical protein
MTTENCGKGYKLSFELALDTNLRFFQYIIFHRILTTHTFLQIQHYDKRSLCMLEVKTILSILLKCHNHMGATKTLVEGSDHRKTSILMIVF